VPNRLRRLDEKVKSVTAALDQMNTAQVARSIGVPESTLRYDLKKVRAALPDVLRNRTPGPKPILKPLATRVRPSREDRPGECPKCQAQRIWKNGGYRVFNWVGMLLAGWLGVRRVWIQRYRCAECGYEIPSAERRRQAEGRRAWWQQVKRLMGLSRFKLGLSARRTQVLVAFVYARQVSLGFIEDQTDTLGRRAEVVLKRLRECPLGWVKLHDEHLAGAEFAYPGLDQMRVHHLVACFRWPDDWLKVISSQSGGIRVHPQPPAGAIRLDAPHHPVELQATGDIPIPLTGGPPDALGHVPGINQPSQCTSPSSTITKYFHWGRLNTPLNKRRYWARRTSWTLIGWGVTSS
jgi:transposase-like protein